MNPDAGFQLCAEDHRLSIDEFQCVDLSRSGCINSNEFYVHTTTVLSLKVKQPGRLPVNTD